MTTTSKKQPPTPVEIERLSDQRIRIKWIDGHEGFYSPFYLRNHCRCAVCVEEWSGKRLIKEGSIPEDIRALKIEGVGHYAIKINWSDGHDTGLYSFDLLREICPCEVCGGKDYHR
jgi:DUF971 family protein